MPPTDDFSSLIGKYEILARLGEGTFAEAFEARAADGTRYALKRNLTDSPVNDERLRNEIRVLKGLDHEGIPAYIDGGRDGTPYLVMTLAPGISLDRALDARRRSGGVHGHVEALMIIRGLLDTLAYLSQQGIAHRDVKAANVLATETASRTTLIDFGFAKRHGEREIRMDDSFWRAGAVRYSPPAKLENPGTADCSHDVFAAGVLGYQLLTGEYPWSVPSTGDIGSYRRHIRTHTPTHIASRNTMVPSEVADLVMALLRTDDGRRPTAADALQTADGLLKSGHAGPANPRPGRVAYPHVCRDPLYGDVRLTDFEWALLSTPEMQRLRFIKQLGLANYVFFGAEHSRLAHAVGCVHRVEQTLATIEAIEGVPVELDTRLIARLFALVHDVTHVAYGHTVEDELGLFEPHDDNIARRRRLLLESTLRTVMDSNDIGRAVLQHFDPEATIQARSGVVELVAGSTGADVLDYIDRDAYHCGLDHRVDSAIFRQFRWHRSDRDGDEPRLISLLYGSEGLRVDREYAVESLLMERYAMFLKVYTNKTKTAASALLGKALTAAVRPGSRGKADFTEAAYEQFGDAEVLVRLELSRKALPAELAHELRRGDLPRGVYRAQLLSQQDRDGGAYDERRAQLADDGYTTPAGRAELEAELARSVGLDAADVIIHCPTKAPGLQRVRHTVADEGRAPRALDSVGNPYQEIKRKHLGLWELWVFSRAPSRERDGALAAAMNERIGLDNLIAQDRRSERLFPVAPRPSRQNA